MLHGYGILNNHVPTLKATAMRGGSVNPLNTSLYAVYKAESNANDSLSAYNGTAQGGLTYSAGKSGNAFTFNGTNAYVSLPNNSLNSLTGDFSINLWVNVANTNTFQTLLSAFEYNGTNYYGFTLFNYGYTRFDIYNGTTSFITLQEPSANPYSTWYMITITRKASTSTKIYYNGTLKASNTNTTNPVYNLPTYTNIGVRNSSGAGIQYYAGNGTEIDELNIWNKELTSTEVTDLYNTGTGKFYPY